MMNSAKTLSRLQRARDLGIRIGGLSPGPLNAITDVSGVKVGQVTLIVGSDIRTGVTAIIPHPGNLYQEKVPAAIAIGNGYGKLIGYTQVEELGELETPLVLTNTLSAPVAAEALIDYTLNQPGNENVISVNPVVGETNDGVLNDIRACFIQKSHVLKALGKAKSGPVDEGTVGAGTGTICLGYKGGIGSSARIVGIGSDEYTLGVLVQTNFGGQLRINRDPVGRNFEPSDSENDTGSCMIVVATDAPLSAHNLKRLARRAFIGLGRTGGIMSNGSGDYAVAFSTAQDLRIKPAVAAHLTTSTVLRNESLNPLFQAVIDTTEEAILNSLLRAKTLTGYKNSHIDVLPIDLVREVLN